MRLIMRMLSPSCEKSKLLSQRLRFCECMGEEQQKKATTEHEKTATRRQPIKILVALVNN